MSRPLPHYVLATTRSSSEWLRLVEVPAPKAKDFARRSAVGVLFAMCLLLSGCQLLQDQLAGDDADIENATASADNGPVNSLLRKLPTPADAVVLEAFVIERPADDPLLGDELWNELDQVAALELQDRRGLQQNGLRLGRAGAQPTQTLQKLLGLGSALDRAAESRLSGQRLGIPSGGETEVTADEQLRDRVITFRDRSGGDTTKRFESARGVFRIRARRLQEGWARVEFSPEVHYGRMVNRPTATEVGWTIQPTQKVERLYEQRFSVDLNLGEMVVLTSNLAPQMRSRRNRPADEAESRDSKPTEQNLPLGSDSVGAQFFLSEVDGRPMQRLLVIRLADLTRANVTYE